MNIPMLEEHEWEQVGKRLQAGIRSVQEYRKEHRVSLHEAKFHLGHGALELYYEMTGFRETNIDALWHHRISQFGPPCAACGKPLRTPQAKFCAACGMLR